MNSTPANVITADHEAAAQSSNQSPQPSMVADDLSLDLEFADVQLGERQPEACSMEEGCQSCQ